MKMRASRPIISQAGFSLVELLATLAIIAVVTSVTLSGFGRTSAARLDGAGEMVGSLIGTAQQEAISSRNPVMMAIPTTGQLAYRTLGMFVRNPQTGEWNQTLSWKRLPSGTVIDPRAEVENSLLHSGITAPAGFPDQVKIGDETMASGSACFFGFDSEGLPIDASVSPARLRLVAGEVIAQGQIQEQNSANRYDLLILPGAANVRHIRP